MLDFSYIKDTRVRSFSEFMAKGDFSSIFDCLECLDVIEDLKLIDSVIGIMFPLEYKTHPMLVGLDYFFGYQLEFGDCGKLKCLYKLKINNNVIYIGK